MNKTSNLENENRVRKYKKGWKDSQRKQHKKQQISCADPEGGGGGGGGGEWGGGEEWDRES